MSNDGSVDRWQTLRRGGHEAAGLEIPTFDTGVGTGFGTIRWALGSQGEPRLLLPIRQAEAVANLSAGPSLVISTATYHLGGSPIRYIDMACVSQALEPVFAEVADEIIRRVTGGHVVQQACRSTLDDFRALLVDPGDEVDAERISGLAGELVLLRRLLGLNADAWQLWRGPLKERHDFRADNLALEVKTSTRVANRSVRISAIDQLEEPAGGELVLCLCQLEKVAGGGVTVASLASEVLALSSSPQKVRELLSAMSCPDPNAPAWNNVEFSLAGQIFLEVRDGFPRIVPGSLPGGRLPAGLSEVRYALDLAAAAGFELSPQAAEQWLGRMVACLP